MENKGLIFIPDISGFTNFVNSMEIEHSSLIIRELLEGLINSNKMGLELSEIEGDAILFYKFGETPDLKQVYRQVESMFCDFHKNIISYDSRRFCQCDACSSAIDLTLKIITHYGEFTGYTVQNFYKLFGKDVIVAHRLLKNEIDLHEYWLVTKCLQTNTPPGYEDWMKWQTKKQDIEGSEVSYYYTQLGELKNNIKPDPVPKIDLSQKTKEVSISKVYDANLIAVFHASGDYNHRSKWMEGVKSVEDVNHFLPRVGQKCRCISDDGHESIFSSSYSFSPERIEFSESNLEDNSLMYYTLESIKDGKTRLTIDHYIDKGFLNQFSFTFKKRKLKERLENSMNMLAKVIMQIKLVN